MDNLNVEVIVLVDSIWYKLKLDKFSMAQTTAGIKFEITGTEKDDWVDEVSAAN